MRHRFLLTLFGLLLGVVAAIGWFLYGPNQTARLAPSALATPQYERWSKHNQCGVTEDRYDATLVLQADVPEAIGQNIKSIMITDSGLDEPSELTINRADLAAQANGGFAPECEEGVCKFTTFYPAHRAKPPEASEPMERRDFALAFKTQDNRVTEIATYRYKLVPTPEQAVSARHIPMSARIDDKRFTISLTPSFDAEIWLDIHLTDANGPQQAGFTMPSNMRGVAELPIDFAPPLRHASVIMTISDSYKAQRYRHGLTIADRGDPFFDCSAERAASGSASELEE